MTCRPCRILDSLFHGVCDTHKLARINYDTSPAQRLLILQLSIAFGYSLKVEGKLRDGEPELML